MTLAAAILLLGSSSLLNSGLPAQAASLLTTQNASAASQENPSQTPAASGTAKSGANQAPTASASAKQKKNLAAKRRVRRKRAAATNCDPAAASSTNSGTSSAGAAGAQPQTGGASDPSKNCPPAKIVVRQGGISEQSIQLAGGSTSEATGKRDAANRMLTATEENLKKISGRQLSTDQQDSANQIRQFMNQSKSAMAAGDLERAQTLAWKAKLLSDDLVDPGK